MYLGAYEFEGEVPALLDGYARMMTSFQPDELDLHLCVTRDGGITVYDACPSQAEFEGFTAGEGFHSAIRAAGLPEPRIVGVGEVREALLREAVRL